MFNISPLIINIRASNAIGMKSFNRCKCPDDSYFPGLGSTITSLKDFLHEVFEEVVDVSLISMLHSWSPLRRRWGKYEGRKGNADKGI